MSHFDVDGGNEMNINAIHDIQAVYIQQSDDIVLKNEADDALYYEEDQTNTLAEDDNIFVNNEVENDAEDSDDALTNTIAEDDNIFVNNEVGNDAVDSDDALTNTIEEDDDIFVNNEVANNAVGSNGALTNTIEEDDNIFINNEVENDAVDSDDALTNTIEEDDNIFINNEVANDAVDSDDILTNTYEVANDAVDSGHDETNSIQENNLTWLPIVYTTRLDEMNIFDKIEKYTPTEAAVLIQYESKPQYKQILPSKREPSGFHSYSFMKLYSDIERLNQIVQTETKLRNEELMSMCKPLKIVLKDIYCDKVKTTDLGSKNFNQTNRKPHSTPKINNKLAKPEMAEKEIVMSVAKFQKQMTIKIDDSDTDSSDDMPLTMLKPSVMNFTQLLPGTTTLAFIDKTSTKADIYIINYSKDLRCSYEYNLDKYNLLKKTYPTNNTIVCDICCWVKREKQIKLLSQSNVANENAISFMRIPHGCLPASCTCCCSLEPTIPMQSSVTFLKMSKYKSETDTEASKLIGKAYSYRTKPQSSKIYAVEPTNVLKNAVIMMKYNGIIFSQSYNLGENYEIGMEGDVDNHVKLTVNRSMTEEKELHEKNDKENKISRQYFPYLICCWFQREETIDSVSKTYNLSPRACKYLRNSHLCNSHKCKCCCKRGKIGLFFDEKNISTLPQSKNQSKGTREDKRKNKVTMDQREASKIRKVYIDNKKYKGKAPENIVAKERINKQNSVAVMVSHRKPETEQAICQSIAEPSIESQPNVAKIFEPVTVPAELMTSIFEKFRDLKLSVNANGTLTANINTPPEKLLTAEIKILADILAKASNQMHELGIEPEEFCRRVNLKPLIMNASPSTGITNLPVPPKLPMPTQPSLLPPEIIPPPPLCPIVKKTIDNTKDIIQPPQGSKRVKQISHPCKTNEFSFSFPRSNNSSKMANLYSTMSSIGWLRNKSMIHSYNTHFDIVVDVGPKAQLRKPQASNEEEQTLPKIVNVQSLVDNAPKTKSKFNRDQSKKKQADKPKSTGETCKIRVLPPERISTLPTNTQSNMPGSANMAVFRNFDKPIEPIPGHSQENMFDRNASLIPIQNVNGELASPLQNASNNFVLAQGINPIAPTMHIPDSGKIWAFIEGKLVELQLAQNVLPASQNNTAFNQNYGISNTGTVIQTPMILVNNGIPMQGSLECLDTQRIDDVKQQTVNVETQESALNSLLRDMLSKESALPNLPQPRKHRYQNARKRTVAPLIRAHSKELELKSKKKKRALNDTIASPVSKENLQNYDKEVTIQLIDSDDEEESIFGV